MRYRILVVLLLPAVVLAGTITQAFTFSPDEVRFAKVDGYDVVSLRDYVSTSAPGEPIIPQAIVTFLVPANATVTNVEVISSTRTDLPGSHYLYPTQTPRTLSEKRVLPFVEPEARIYRTGSEFPGRLVSFGYTGTKTGYRLCGVSIFPVQYAPVSGRVALYTSVTLRVTYDEAGYDAIPLTQKQLDLAGREVRTLVCNPEELTKFRPPVRASDVADAEYVIIADTAYHATLAPLAEWHLKKGYTTIFKTPAWITSHYTGYDNAEKIRNFIIDYYTNHGTIFVLLAGSASSIPARRGYANVGGTIGNVPADLYYGDLQWSWDGDHDHTYGESSGDTVDFYYDIFVGRAPIASTANAQTLVSKAFGYERAPNTSYIKKVYLPYVNLFTGYTGKVVSDTISLITPTGWTDQEVNSPGTSAFQSAINAGYGYCHAAAHGDAYGFYTDMGMPIYTTSEAGAQTNGMDKLCVMNSMACISGNFESQTCLSVTLANNANGGTAANMLNSREGWGTPPTMGPSEKYNVRFFDFLLNMDTFAVGVAMARGKDYYASLPQQQEVWRWCAYDINLLGDPAMPLWSDVPGTISITRPDSVPTGTSSIRVTVTSSGSPVPNASVGLYKPGEICIRGRTNSSGQADIIITPSTTGRLYVTVSAQDKYPVQDSIRVYAGSPMPYLSYESLVIDDAGGNGNGRLDPGETVNLLVTVRNIGNTLAHSTAGTLRTASSYIALTDSSSSYGDIAQNGTSQGDAYRVSASSGTPPGSLITFTAHLVATEGSWDPTFDVIVGQAHQPGSVWADIDTADCVLSVTCLGSIGMVAPDGQGHGFRYPKAGTSRLYYSGLLVGNSASYVVDHYYGQPASSVNTDFVTADSVRATLPAEMGDEQLTARFSDAGHGTPKGMVVTQRAVQVSTPGYHDFTILVYDIANQGSAAISACYAGIITDFDIGGTTDIARTNDTKRIAWMRNSTSANPTLGLRLLFPTVLANASVIDHDRYVYPTDSAMSESMKYRFLNGALHSASSNRSYDWSIVTSTGPFDLPVGGSQRVALAMVGGSDTASFIANSDSAQSWWDRNAGVFGPSDGSGRLPGMTFVRLAPNPFSTGSIISYVMPSAGRLTIRVYDAAGNLASEVFDREIAAGTGTISWRPTGLNGGIYFLKATTPGGSQTEKLMLVR